MKWSNDIRKGKEFIRKFKKNLSMLNCMCWKVHKITTEEKNKEENRTR